MPIGACKIKRIEAYKVVDGIATTSKSTMGLCVPDGSMLQITINDKGETLDFMITQASIDDRTFLKSGNFRKELFGSLYVDKSYI